MSIENIPSFMILHVSESAAGSQPIMELKKTANALCLPSNL